MKTYDEGSVFGTKAVAGTVYLQFVRQVERSVDLVRVLAGSYDQKPDLERLVSMPTVDWHLLPIRYLARRKNSEVDYLGVYKIPDVVPEIMLNQRLRTGEYLVQPIDGSSSLGKCKKLDLTDEQILNTPQLSYVNLAYIQQETSRSDATITSAKARSKSKPSLTHYLYFSTEEAASVAADEIKKHCDVSVLRNVVDEEGPRRFSVIVIDSADPQDTTRYSEAFGIVCSMFDGEYDGWEQSDDANP